MPDPVQSERAARLMELLGLSDEELCATLDADPLTLLSGQLDHRPELSILLALLDEASRRASPATLRRWVRASGPAGRPVDALVARDFEAFEDAVGALAERGFIVRGGGTVAEFAHRMRVRYAECDAQGAVFNAHYLAYVDQALTEFWRALFGGYAHMTDRGLDVVVAEAQLRFRAPARFDEEIDVGVGVAGLGTTSMTLHDRIVRADDGTLLCAAQLRYVWITSATRTPTPVPDWARAALELHRVPAETPAP